MATNEGSDSADEALVTRAGHNRPRIGLRPDVSGPRRRTSLLAPLSAGASLVVIAVLGATFLLGAPSDGPAVVPSPPTVPVSSPLPVNPRPVARVPDSIDATGATDVTDALQSFLDNVEDGSTIQMHAGGRYRVDETLWLVGRHDLEWDGSGATIEATTEVATNRRNISLSDSTWIRIHDLTIRGTNPAPSTFDEAHQFEHGIWIDGGSDIEIAAVAIENPRGDCIYIGDGDGSLAWAERISIHDSTCKAPGRNGIAVVGGRDVRIESNAFEAVGLHVVDIEPNRVDGRGGTEEARPVQGAANVAVLENGITGPVPGYFFAANGWGKIDGLIVRNNELAQAPLRITVQPLPESGFIRTGIIIQGNRSDTAYDAADDAAMRFTRTTDLTVRGNLGPLTGAGSALVEIRESCRIDVGGNEYPGGALELRGIAGACPAATAATLVRSAGKP